MSIIRDGSLTQIQQLRAAVKAAATSKRAATDEARHIARQAAVEREVVGRSIRLAPARGARLATPNFAAPAKRKKEYRSSSGLRTFHFGWSSVSKSSAPRGAPGTRVYANAAASHIVYIEDGVIARQGHTVYIDSSRVETSADGERLVLSNISEHYEERVEFFRLVDQFERVNHGDTVDIDFNVNPALWQPVTEDQDCDPAIVAAYANAANPSKPAKDKAIALLGPGSELRVLMAKHGFVFADPVVNEERLKRDGFCFHDGRGGRTEYRLVFELPREFNRKQRARVLKLLCRRFKQAGCMYVAVIHAPDPHNDQDNYHIHLDFYDRKCRRLDGSKRDLDNVKPQFLKAIKREIADGSFREEVRKGAWDFTVVRKYQSNKKKTSHRPFRAANKSEPLRDRGFVRKVREGFAKDVNAVARKVGLGELYDPRDYAAMGINRPSSKKLGPKKHGQETKGIPTTIGIDNEAAQAEFEIRIIEQAYQDRCRHIDEIQFGWQAVSEQTPPELSAAKRAVEEELAKAREAAEIRRELDHLTLERERERSRARFVSERQWRASLTGSSAAQARSTKLAESADDHLAILDEQDVDLVKSMALLESVAAGHGPEQAASAVLDFEREMARFEADRQSRPSSDESSAPARRNIVVKRGTLGQVDGRPAAVSDRPQVVPASVAKRSSHIEVEAAPAELITSTATTTIQSGAADRPKSVSASNQSGDLSRREHLVATDLMNEAPAADGRQEPPYEPPEPAIGITDRSRMSLLVENTSPPATANGRYGRPETAGPRPSDSADFQNELTGPDSPPAAPNGAQALPAEDNCSVPPTSSRTGIRAVFTDQEIQDILRPRLVGPDGVFRPVDKWVNDADEPETLPATTQGLDPITAAKALWAFGDLSPVARAGLSEADKDIYSQAVQHPRGGELQAALGRGRANHRQAVSALKENELLSDEAGDPRQRIPIDPTIKLLVASFYDAENTADLRKATVAVRAMPAARAYMDTTKDKRWLTENTNIEEEQDAMRKGVDKYRG